MLPSISSEAHRYLTPFISNPSVGLQGGRLPERSMREPLHSQHSTRKPELDQISPDHEGLTRFRRGKPRFSTGWIQGSQQGWPLPTRCTRPRPRTLTFEFQSSLPALPPQALAAAGKPPAASPGRSPQRAALLSCSVPTHPPAEGRAHPTPLALRRCRRAPLPQRETPRPPSPARPMAARGAATQALRGTPATPTRPSVRARGRSPAPSPFPPRRVRMRAPSRPPLAPPPLKVPRSAAEAAAAPATPARGLCAAASPQRLPPGEAAAGRAVSPPLRVAAVLRRGGGKPCGPGEANGAHARCGAGGRCLGVLPRPFPSSSSAVRD